MKYKIYKIKDTNTVHSDYSLTTDHKICVFLDQILDKDEDTSLGKLLHATGISKEKETLLINNKDLKRFFFKNDFYKFKFLEQIWVFGSSPDDFGFPQSTPFARPFIFLGQCWMFFPSYPSILKNDKLKRDLWKAIQNIKTVV